MKKIGSKLKLKTLHGEQLYRAFVNFSSFFLSYLFVYWIMLPADNQSEITKVLQVWGHIINLKYKQCHVKLGGAVFLKFICCILELIQNAWKTLHLTISMFVTLILDSLLLFCFHTRVRFSVFKFSTRFFISVFHPHHVARLDRKKTSYILKCRCSVTVLAYFSLEIDDDGLGRIFSKP